MPRGATRHWVDGIYRCVVTMSRPPECLLILGPMRYSDACSPPDEQITRKNAKKHADHRRCRRDGCLLRYHRAERERERSNEGDAPSFDESAPNPRSWRSCRWCFALSQNLESQEPKPSGQETQIHVVTTLDFKWQNDDDGGGGTTTGRWFIL